jgi:hypothetical protein
MSTSWNRLEVNFRMQETACPLDFPVNVMKDLVEAAQKVNSHASPPRELISGEPFHMLSLFISISNSHPTRRVVPSINTPLCTTKKLRFDY